MVMQNHAASRVSMDEASMDEAMVQKNCNDGCTCNDISMCGYKTSNASPFIVFDQNFKILTESVPPPVEQLVQYRSQITTPDIHPPIV